MNKKSVFSILGILVGFNVLAWIGVFQLSHANLEVTFFDVGQGDSIFIETTGNQQILIDGGPDSAVLEKLGKAMPFWDRTIDLIILTHPEHDHVAGLLLVLKRYKVENILWTGVLRDTDEYKEWVRLLQEEGANIYIAQSGLRISGGTISGGRADIDILYPFEGLEGEEVKNTNDTSVISRLVFGETSFLFTGDASKSIERKLGGDPTSAQLGGGRVSAQLDSDVLKVGHHGSKTSTSAEFVAAVSPEIAVISAGKDNKYGHPHQEVLDNLSGIMVLRTDLEGDIKIVSDGASYIVKK